MVRYKVEGRARKISKKNSEKKSEKISQLHQKQASFDNFEKGEKPNEVNSVVLNLSEK